MPNPLRDIRKFDDLVRYLETELDWPVAAGSFDDLTFEYQPAELGLKDEDAVKIKKIHQLRPLTTGQPWGIFFIEFEKKKLPVVVLRCILSHLVVKKRQSANKADQAVWNPEDLLFISAFGEETSDQREIAFAHFHQQAGDLPTLRVLGWDGGDTPLKLDYVAGELKEKLHWPQNPKDQEAWRAQWRAPFRHRIGHVIRTADSLAEVLAALARGIRDRCKIKMRAESEHGALTKLYKGFQTALIHDLKPDDFADTYAQTITYGLLTAAISRTEMSQGRHGTVLYAENVTDMVPITNPFLKEMLQMFLKVGGRKGGIDFDELGIQDVVELLRGEETDLPAILRDFGNKTRGEDPVIHFYEHFLSAYNKQLKIQRGVFYTPQPVVSYIVRSVHELLQTEFGLDDGLADTTTWGEMVKKHPGLKLPPLTDEPGEKRTIDPAEPFVQILDPATGTATFFVEVIDVIYQTMVAKWKQAGKNTSQIQVAWNDYVPKHLLPRVYGFELMMAPYAIAHMKVGLKLTETGYQFGSDERVRIFLTNSLEPKMKQLPQIGFEPLAHEAEEVNKIKWYKRFTVVIGNPPYSNFGMLNKIPFILDLLEDYKRDLDEKKINLDDDFIKFIRFSQHLLDTTGSGVFGMITNNSFLDGVTHRQMRQSMGQSYQSLSVLNLHGSANLGETCSDGSPDENVFDIRQGVGVTLCVKRCSVITNATELRYEDLWGLRERKYRTLEKMLSGGNSCSNLPFDPPYFFFVPKNFGNQGEYEKAWKLVDVFLLNQTGVKTDRDELFFDFEKQFLDERIRKFYSADGLKEPFRTEFRVEDSSSYKLLARRRATAFDASNIVRCVYRPFDKRWLYYSPSLTSRPGYDVMRHMIAGSNLGLVTLRINGAGEEFVVICSDSIVEKGSLPRGNYSLFPLYVFNDQKTAQRGLEFDDGKRPGFSKAFLSELAACLKLSVGNQGLPQGVTPEDIFHYAYGVFHSPGYRSRYAEFLKIDFPRLPLTGNLELFRALAHLGGELVALHLLEFEVGRVTPYAPGQKPSYAQLTEFIGGRSPVMEKVSWSKNTVWLDKAQTTGFQGVREDVWNFHIGGYQVCEKWLKDRKGRNLSADDRTHYQKIIIALSETIRLMKEIDAVIALHGGWPLK